MRGLISGIILLGISISLFVVFFTIEEGRRLLLISFMLLGPILAFIIQLIGTNKLDRKSSLIYSFSLFIMFPFIVNGFMILRNYSGEWYVPYYDNSILLRLYYPLGGLILTWFVMLLGVMIKDGKTEDMISAYRIASTLLFAFGILLFFMETENYIYFS